MAQFRTSADLVSSVLRRCGENPDSTSSYYTQAIDYLNQIHHTVITGGSEFNLEVDEPWVWARSHRPLILELQPVFTTGTVGFTQGSSAGYFNTVPSASYEGYHIKLDSGPEIYRIVEHTAAAASFSIDGNFGPTTTVGSTYRAFKLDYDLVSDIVVIDSQNDKLDFIVSGTTVLTAALTHGSYTPAQLASQVALQLIVADSARLYTCTYDTNRRYFSIVSNLAAGAVFKPQGAGTNSYRSAWPTLGFDYVNAASAATQTSSYPHSTVIRLTEPARLYYNDITTIGGDWGSVGGLDPLAMDREFPLAQVRAGTPSAFAVVREKNDGTLTVRFNKYPDRKMRVEFEHVPIPRDLQNNSASVPLIPRKFIRVLEYGAAFYILTDKRDAKADKYFQIAQSTLKAMMVFNRKELQRIGKNFGNVVARWDLMPDAKKRRLCVFGYDSGSF